MLTNCVAPNFISPDKITVQKDTVDKESTGVAHINIDKLFDYINYKGYHNSTKIEYINFKKCLF